ncbi:GIY-YIG nuclease family protein [Allohahella marinimesophila]|uniref:GIY-YIG nuclease family protein n=1 Tax=Allohahella marinimesophila TaxID=1054972 RepID=A0ABP7NJI7_9GAMM
MTAAKASEAWYVYMLECADGSFYTGITTDWQRRELEHNESDKLGAKYTRARRPVRLVWLEPQPDRAAASKREYALKRWSRTRKLKMIEDSSRE